MSIPPDLEDPIVMDCPGSGCPGNLSDGSTGLCQYCNDLLPLVCLPLEDGGALWDVIPIHQTADIIAMIGRGDFGPRSEKNRSRS